MKTERYQNIGIKKTKPSVDRNTKGGKRFFNNAYYPVIEAEVDDYYVIAKVGDRLDIYAHKYYGDSRLWTIIAHANKLGKGSMVAPAGMRIWIPMNIGKIQEDYDNLQNNI